MFYLLLPSLVHRQGFIEHLKARGVLSVFHYLPLHLSDMGREFGGQPGDCPVTEDISDRLLRLPFYNDLTEADQERVCQTIESTLPCWVRSNRSGGRRFWEQGWCGFVTVGSVAGFDEAV